MTSRHKSSWMRVLNDDISLKKICMDICLGDARSIGRYVEGQVPVSIFDQFVFCQLHFTWNFNQKQKYSESQNDPLGFGYYFIFFFDRVSSKALNRGGKLEKQFRGCFPGLYSRLMRRKKRYDAGLKTPQSSEEFWPFHLYNAPFFPVVE